MHSWTVTYPAARPAWKSPCLALSLLAHLALFAGLTAAAPRMPAPVPARHGAHGSRRRCNNKPWFFAQVHGVDQDRLTRDWNMTEARRRVHFRKGATACC